MITKEMKIVDVLQAKPDTARIFTSYGMGCIHCLIANTETVEEAAMHHGINLDEMMGKLNA